MVIREEGCEVKVRWEMKVMGNVRLERGGEMMGGVISECADISTQQAAGFKTPAKFSAYQGSAQYTAQGNQWVRK